MKVNPSISVLFAVLLVANVIFIYSLKSVAVGTAVQEIEFDYQTKLKNVGSELSNDADYLEMKARFAKIKDKVKEERAKRFLEAFFNER